MLFHYFYFICSIGGFFLELLYRKYKFNKWIKPGVFKGFYLPLYGLGLVICYLCYKLPILFILKLLLAGILLTLIELICGVIFIKKYKIPLWDYSTNFGNYKGLICVKFSLIWFLLALVTFFIFSKLNVIIYPFLKIIIFVFEFIMLIDVISFFIQKRKAFKLGVNKKIANFENL